MRRFACELGATLLGLVAYCGAVGALAFGAVQFIPTPAGVAAVLPLQSADWVEIARPYAAFAITTGEFEATETHYVIRRHTLGGRKDILRFGDATGSAPHLLIEIYRAGSEYEHFAVPAVEIAARVADDLGSSGDMKGAGWIEMKFGRLALVEFAVASAAGERRCLGFARAFEEPTLQIAGWYCRTGPAMIDRGLLACALDRLTLVSAGSDAKVAELFARAEIKRKFCGHHSAVLAPTPKPASWIDSAKEPTLRGRFAAR